jgi:hypothetical protein
MNAVLSFRLFLVRNSFCSSINQQIKGKQSHVSDVIHLLPSVQNSSTTESAEFRQHILLSLVKLKFFNILEGLFSFYVNISDSDPTCILFSGQLSPVSVP